MWQVVFSHISVQCRVVYSDIEYIDIYRVNNPTLNRNVGKYNLPHIWDKVLFTIPELRIN